MSRRPAIFLFVLLPSLWANAGHALVPMSCEAAASEAERSHRLPAGLLAAIGRVESGRADATGHVVAWPWTIDAAGAGTQLPSAEAAVASVQALQQQGQRNIDVGCFQVNLAQHPGAFATLDAAFDPRANADYAAQFLAALRQRTGTWEAAVAAYHSATPALGTPYQQQVFAQWGAEAPPPDIAEELRPGGYVVMAGVRVWTPGSPGSAPQVIHIDPAALVSAAAQSLTK